MLRSQWPVWRRTPAVTTVTAVNVWNGSTWVARPVYVWSGSAWVRRPVTVFNGTTWN